MTRTHTKFTAVVLAFAATFFVQGSMLAGFDAMAERSSQTQAQAAATAQTANIVVLPRVEITYVRS